MSKDLPDLTDKEKEEIKNEASLNPKLKFIHYPLLGAAIIIFFSGVSGGAQLGIIGGALGATVGSVLAFLIYSVGIRIAARLLNIPLHTEPPLKKLYVLEEKARKEKWQRQRLNRIYMYSAIAIAVLLFLIFVAS